VVDQSEESEEESSNTSSNTENDSIFLSKSSDI
jgi:hypothetical protein